MVNYAVEKTLILMFSEDEFEKVNEALEINITIEDEVEIMDFEIETLFETGLINEDDFNELKEIDELTKIIVCFEEN